MSTSATPTTPTDDAAAPWLAAYDPRIPATLVPYPDRTLLDYLAEAAAERPDDTAVLFTGARLTWAELARLSDHFAAGLVALGVVPGDRVATFLPNCPQFLIAQFGAWKAGAICCPLNPLYSEAELAGALGRLGAETIVVLTPFYGRAKAIEGQTPLKRIIATNIKEYLPPFTRVLFTVAKERKEGHRIELHPGDHWFAGLLALGATAVRPAIAVAPDDPALILSSGGTTGTPKGVLGTHRATVIAGLQLRAWVTPVIGDRADVMMLPLPLFHVFANVGALGLAVVGGHPLALIPNPRDLGALLKAIRQTKPAIFLGVPTLFIGMMGHPDAQAGKVDFRSIKLTVSGSAPLLAETKERFEALTGGTIVEGYSTTEALMACTVNPVGGPGKLGSVGVPLPDVRVRIADADDPARNLPPGEIGEIIIGAPQLMRGYWGDEAETALVLRPTADGATELLTGDLGYMDAEGYVFIVDRKKDLIKTSGYQVWPREIEEVIAAHPAVAEVSVAGVPDSRKGEVARAWVVLAPDASATEDDLRAWCRDRLAPYKVPGAVEFRDALPKTAVGKVLRRELTAEARAAQGVSGGEGADG